MKLRLPLNRSIGTGLAVLAAGLTREAAERLAGVAAKPVGSVHGTRVALKRARSALRLLEKAGADWAIMPRYRLAELAAKLSAAREAAVMAALAKDLARRLRGPERTVANLLAVRTVPLGPAEVEPLRQALLLEWQGLAVAPVPAIAPGQLRDLLRRSLDRTVRRYYEAAVKPTPVSVHEWRKAVIVLRDQAALAASRWPQGAGLAHPLLAGFARQLGHRGDLALLGRCLQTLRVSPELQPARRALLARLTAQREKITLEVMVGWLDLQARLRRLLAEEID